MKQQVIGIVGPSGGIGKSTIAKELAIAISSTEIQNSNIRTCLIDVNLVFGSQKSFFKINQQYTIRDWILQYRKDIQFLSIEEAERRYNWDFIQQFLAYSKEFATYILPAPSDGRVLDISKKELQHIIYILKNFFDIILIDTGNNLSNVTIATLLLSDTVFLIVNDDARTIKSAKNLRKSLRSIDISLDKIKLVVNRFPLKTKNRIYTIKDIETILYMDVCSVLPEEKRSWMLNNTGIPIITYKNTKLKKELLKLAHQIVPEVNIK